MIIKYLKGANWIYKDGICKINKRRFTIDELIKRYEQSIIEGIRDKDFLSQCISSNEELANKCFYAASDYIHTQCPIEHIVCPETLNFDNKIDLIELICSNSNNNEIIITSEPVYLMNDEGKTIERLG